MNEYWSYILAPFGLIGLWMSGNRNRWGWALSIGAQILWLTYAVQTEQWGFVPGSAAYGLIYLRNFIGWSKKPAGATTDELTAELARITTERDFWEQAANRNGELYSAAENQRDEARDALNLFLITAAHRKEN